MRAKKGTKFTIKTTGTHQATASKPEFEVIEEMFELGKRGNGTVRLDYGSWNGNEPKYELRVWKEKDGIMQATKGIGLTGEELIALKNALDEMTVE